MADDDLYQGILLDHFRHPRNRRVIEPGGESWQERNPACGDTVRLHADLRAARLDHLIHDTHGCAISVASASIMTAMLEGGAPVEALRRAEDFMTLLKGDAPLPAGLDDRLAAIATVRKFPMRIKCALLPWVALSKWMAVVARESAN